jgi:hypothetical protein
MPREAPVTIPTLPVSRPTIRRRSLSSNLIALDVHAGVSDQPLLIGEQVVDL